MIDKNFDLEKLIFKKIIQHDIIIEVDDEEKTILKEGKLINFSLKIPFLNFVINNGGIDRSFMIPQPFTYSDMKNGIRLSYKFSEFTTNKEVIEKIYELGNPNQSKLFDNYVWIKSKKVVDI